MEKLECGYKQWHYRGVWYIRDVVSQHIISMETINELAIADSSHLILIERLEHIDGNDYIKFTIHRDDFMGIPFNRLAEFIRAKKEKSAQRGVRDIAHLHSNVIVVDSNIADFLTTKHLLE